MARAAAAEESLVGAIVAGARAAGLMLETIAPVDGGPGLALLPSNERAGRERTARRVVRRLAIATAAVWVAVGAVFVARLAWERRRVERELARLEEPLAAVLAARRDVRAATTAVAAVATTHAAGGRAVAVLGAVAAALPDSAVLTSFEWRADGEGILTGSARRASEVVARLERSGAIPRPRLEGPTVREVIAGRDWERFMIVFGETARRSDGVSRLVRE